MNRIASVVVVHSQRNLQQRGLPQAEQQQVAQTLGLNYLAWLLNYQRPSHPEMQGEAGRIACALVVSGVPQADVDALVYKVVKPIIPAALSDRDFPIPEKIEVIVSYHLHLFCQFQRQQDFTTALTKLRELDTSYLQAYYAVKLYQQTKNEECFSFVTAYLDTKPVVDTKHMKLLFDTISHGNDHVVQLLGTAIEQLPITYNDLKALGLVKLYIANGSTDYLKKVKLLLPDIIYPLAVYCELAKAGDEEMLQAVLSFSNTEEGYALQGCELYCDMLDAGFVECLVPLTAHLQHLDASVASHQATILRASRWCANCGTLTIVRDLERKVKKGLVTHGSYPAAVCHLLTADLKPVSSVAIVESMTIDELLQLEPADTVGFHLSAKQILQYYNAEMHIPMLVGRSRCRSLSRDEINTIRIYCMKFIMRPDNQDNRALIQTACHVLFNFVLFNNRGAYQFIVERAQNFSEDKKTDIRTLEQFFISVIQGKDPFCYSVNLESATLAFAMREDCSTESAFIILDQLCGLHYLEKSLREEIQKQRALKRPDELILKTLRTLYHTYGVPPEGETLNISFENEHFLNPKKILETVGSLALLDHQTELIKQLHKDPGLAVAYYLYHYREQGYKPRAVDNYSFRLFRKHLFIAASTPINTTAFDRYEAALAGKHTDKWPHQRNRMLQGAWPLSPKPLDVTFTQTHTATSGPKAPAYLLQFVDARHNLVAAFQSFDACSNCLVSRNLNYSTAVAHFVANPSSMNFRVINPKTREIVGYCSMVLAIGKAADARNIPVLLLDLVHVYASRSEKTPIIDRIIADAMKSIAAQIGAEKLVVATHVDEHPRIFGDKFENAAGKELEVLIALGDFAEPSKRARYMHREGGEIANRSLFAHNNVVEEMLARVKLLENAEEARGLHLDNIAV